MAPRRSRAGLLIIRIWADASPAVGIRARIIRALDLEAGITSTAYAHSAEDVSATVQSWLDAFVASAGRQPPPGTDDDASSPSP
jgi:hypothetical protein